MKIVGGKEVFTTLDEVLDPRHCALVVVDMQNDFVAVGGNFDTMVGSAPLREVIPRVQQLLDAARRHGVMVVYVVSTNYPGFRYESPAFLRRRLVRAAAGYYQHEYDAEELLAESPLIEGTWGWNVLDDITPAPDDVIVRKYRTSGFAGTNLDLILRSNGIKTVVCAGIVTQGCVMATIHDAQYADYYTVLAADCTASQSPKLKDAALLIMSRVGDVATLADVCASWDRATGIRNVGER